MRWHVSPRLLKAEIGPTRKCQATAKESGYWGRAENICSIWGLPGLIFCDIQQGQW